MSVAGYERAVLSLLPVPFSVVHGAHSTLTLRLETEGNRREPKVERRKVRDMMVSTGVYGSSRKVRHGVGEERPSYPPSSLVSFTLLTSSRYGRFVRIVETRDETGEMKGKESEPGPSTAISAHSHYVHSLLTRRAAGRRASPDGEECNEKG